MKLINTKFEDVKILTPDIYQDERGYFFESFNTKEFADLTGSKASFKQDNQSRSIKNVIRGLHYQIGSAAQGKLVRVLNGEILDVVVDIRKGSKTFGQWTSVIISDENNFQLWIPAGFAHGFLTLSEYADVFYKTTEYYNPISERTIKWNDEVLRIDWGIETPIVSDKDSKGQCFNQAEYI